MLLTVRYKTFYQDRFVYHFRKTIFYSRSSLCDPYLFCDFFQPFIYKNVVFSSFKGKTKHFLFLFCYVNQFFFSVKRQLSNRNTNASERFLLIFLYQQHIKPHGGSFQQHKNIKNNK